MDQLASTKTGVEAVTSLIGTYDIRPSQDGLELASPDEFDGLAADGVTMPLRLQDFLMDIRLLKRVPLSYLVPDPNLLPPESIRFFHVNQTWVDRVIDGVFSTTNIGTVDFHYNLTLLRAVRDLVDPAPGRMTGLLIRSELVRRWPKMKIAAFDDRDATVDAESQLHILRAEAISRDVFIALFDGQPRRVHIREPFEGVRFGVEGDAPAYHVDARNPKGTLVDPPTSVPVAIDPALRTIDVVKLRDQLAPRGMADPRGVALHLEQRPFVQIFLDTVDELEGSTEPPEDLRVPLRRGKSFTLDFARHALFKLEV